MGWKSVMHCAVALLATAALVGCAGTTEGGEKTEKSALATEDSATDASVTEATETAPTSTEPTEAESTATGLLAPDDADDLEGDNYEDVVEGFESEGFTNVETEVIDDLIIGLIVKDGEVEEVSINGDTDFDNETAYPADASVVVTYHTFPEDDESDDGDDTGGGDVRQEILTAKNNEDLAKLLRGDNCGPSVGQFAKEYEDRRIRFAGWIGAMAQHGDYDTRYDILILPGDTNMGAGPSFKFEDVNLSSSLHWSGRQPNRIGVGDEFTFTVELGEYVGRTCLYFVDPVKTQVR